MADLGTSSRCPCVEFFVTLDSDGLSTQVNKESYDGWPLIDATCHITQHSDQDTGQIGAGKRPQSMNRIGKQEGVYLDVFNLSREHFCG